MASSPDIFIFKTLADGIVSVRDVQPTGVVAFAKCAAVGTGGSVDIRAGRRVAGGTVPTYV